MDERQNVSQGTKYCFVENVRSFNTFNPGGYSSLLTVLPLIYCFCFKVTIIIALQLESIPVIASALLEQQFY